MGNGECGMWNMECGLRPLRAVGSIYEPEAVGAIGACAPEGMGKSEVGMRKVEFGMRNLEMVEGKRQKVDE